MSEKVKDAWGNVTHKVETDIWGNEHVYEVGGLFGESKNEVGTRSHSGPWWGNEQTLTDNSGHNVSSTGGLGHGSFNQSDYSSLSKSSSNKSEPASSAPSSGYASVGGGYSGGGHYSSPANAKTGNETVTVIKAIIGVVSVILVIAFLPYILLGIGLILGACILMWVLSAINS